MEAVIHSTNCPATLAEENCILTLLWHKALSLDIGIVYTE